MRLEGVIIIASLGLLFTEGTRCSRSYTHVTKHRTKPREIRGFKPEYLATAIGFGKRESSMGIPKQNKHEDIILALLRKSPQNIPMEWLAQKLQRNPDLAKQMAARIITGDQNGKLSTAELFKAERTLSIL